MPGHGAEIRPSIEYHHCSTPRVLAIAFRLANRDERAHVTDDAGAREFAAQDLERELSKLFARARSVSLSLAASVHPGLDGASYVLLLHLGDISPVRAADVVERTGLDKSTVSRQVARLEELDLIERVPDPSDGRARLVQLTKVGTERLAKVRADRRHRLRARFTDWPTGDVQEFARLLAKLNSDL
jgi:DNA-binding MarR family transcriptional regulator